MVKEVVASIEIHELLKDHQAHMTEFQHDHFVTGKAGTPYAQYKQSLRELSSRIDILRDEYASLEYLKISIDEKAHDKENHENEFERRRAAVDHKKMVRQISSNERQIKSVETEILSFYRHAVQLKAIVGELTPEKEEQYTIELWEYKVKKMAALEIMTNGKLGISTLDLAISLKGDLRQTVLEAFNNPGKLVEEVESKSEEYTKSLNGSGDDKSKIDFKTLLQLTDK